jgi:hypothetical protein
VLLLAMTLAPGGAGAATAKRVVPKQFVGVMWDREIQDAPRKVQKEQWATMAASGVESARAIFSWDLAQPEKGKPVYFTLTDVMVEEAARHGIDLLPVVTYAPAWTRVVAHPASAPADNAAYARYLTELVDRYGPEGTFWSANPGVPKRPIRAWQIWNEPALDWQFKPHTDWAPRYGKLLRSAYKAVKAVDPTARVVLGGLANNAWDAIDKLYRIGGIRGYFDVAAVHIYSGRADDFSEIVRRFRAAIDRNGDLKKRIYATEAGASASKGVLEAPEQEYFQVTHKQMAKLVPAVFKRLAQSAEKLWLERVYWYTWASGFTYDRTIFGFSGLNAYAPGTQVHPLAGLDGFRKMARGLQGCEKDTKARCKR